MLFPLLTQAVVQEPVPRGATLIVAPLADAKATALSHDGKTLVGVSRKRAFAWEIKELEESSPEARVRILSDPGAALAVSDDGSVIVGNGLVPGQAQFEGARWIGTIPSAEPPWGPRIGGIAAGVSGDGKVIVGSASLNYEVRSRRARGIGEAAILWSTPRPPSEEESAQLSTAFLDQKEASSLSETNVQGLGLGWGSEATAVSRDGLMVVGVLPKPGPGFRWTEAAGVLPIGDLPGGAVATVPKAVNEDGAVIVGSARSANGEEAFRWTEKEGMVPLGDLPGIAFRSVARGVSADGRIIVGTGAGERIGESGGGDRAFIWDAKNGMRDLWAVIVEQGRGGWLPKNFSRWKLRDAVSVRITADGHPQIAGTAVDTVGQRVAFVATLGETVAP